MENTNQSSPVARMIPFLIFFFGLLGIYYLYQYLFGPKTANQYELLSEQKQADVDAKQEINISVDKLPKIYEGGEFTVSTWIYVSNWGYNKGRYKSIFRLGGSTFDTIRIYLGKMKPSLHIRLDTKDSGSTNTLNNDGTESLANVNAQSLFTNTQPESELLASSSPMCDFPEIDLQRWVNIVVTANGKTVDVYIDGKLSRSCVLPSFYRVDSAGYSARLLSFGGFGGFIGSTSMYDSALNPDTVYKNYIAGPDPITTFGGLLKSIFNFGVNISVDTK